MKPHHVVYKVIRWENVQVLSTNYTRSQHILSERGYKYTLHDKMFLKLAVKSEQV